MVLVLVVGRVGRVGCVGWFGPQRCRVFRDLFVRLDVPVQLKFGSVRVASVQKTIPILPFIHLVHRQLIF